MFLVFVFFLCLMPIISQSQTDSEDEKAEEETPVRECLNGVTFECVNNARDATTTQEPYEFETQTPTTTTITPIPDCDIGYQYDDQVAQCVDINECENQTLCPENSLCYNKPGSFECINLCETGYKLMKSFRGSVMESTHCEDINECTTRTHNCTQEQNCINSLGGFQCECKSGYVMNKETGLCDDIDECTSPSYGGTDIYGYNRLQCSGDSRVCRNIPGSYECVCKDGYKLFRTTNYYGIAYDDCRDIDECEDGTHNCSDTETCLNNVGGFQCLCKSGFSKNNTSGLCEDINECDNEEICDGFANFCLNTIGSYTCACLDGFWKDSKGRCRDINECKTGTHSCTPEKTCVNKLGFFECREEKKLTTN